MSGGDCLNPQAPLARKVPVDAAASTDHTRHMLTDAPLQRRAPWNERKPKSIVDHCKATGGQIEAPTVSTAHRITFCRRPMRQSGLRRKLCGNVVQLTSSQRAEQVAGKNDALTLPARQPLLGQMIDARLDCLIHLSAKS